ncbi:histidine kinase [Flavobacterium sp. Sd200]|uniref:2TM domain-containing protein n=1 Tax=Flavobacterium sp. Sd200 TaxID=2692211 RepID=UPI0013692AED|nr:2TM domain-containing protein [Flavobacterium sp. Sd200]MXN89880.1 histidine kinase [Flavobacterium sp. Sd200]
MKSNNKNIAYLKARQKAREIRGFYYNLMCYSIVIPILVFINLKFNPQFHWFWFSLVGWGTGVVFHGLSAFGRIPFMGADWEERKLREFMEKDKENKI